MSAYLVTGRGGSGKTAVCEELQRRGLTAFDADRVPGLARAENNAGEPVEVDWSAYVDYSKVAWNWNCHVLDKLIANHKSLFLCGSADNQLAIHNRFDKVFVLSLDQATHAKRLESRNSVYGKHPDMKKHLLQEQQAFAKEAVAQGAIPIDAAQPLPKLIDEILRQTGVAA